MTKDQCTSKVKEMIRDNHLLDWLKKECDRLMRCGGINLDSYEDNFAAPKILLVVALRNLADNYLPRNSTWIKTIKNLENF